MIYSIKFKLFGALCSLVLLFIVISYLLNSTLLEKYYIYNKENLLKESYKKISALYNVSHELKTPIALIQGYSEGLKMNVNEDEANKNYYCDVIIDEAGKMNKLVKQLLDLAELQYNEISLYMSCFNIMDLVECVVKRNQVIFKEKSVDFKIEKFDDVFVNADYERTEQVLANYLANAVNHVDSQKIVRIGLEKLDGKVRVHVYNSGSHIQKDAMDKIWASFYKIDKARTREYGGSGLGLSIVKAIQDAHGNAYGVSNVENGVDFWFELNIAKDDC